jgi:hypothetical protein
MADTTIIGKTAHVTAKITPGRVGEVTLGTHGSTEIYDAYGYTTGTFEPGTLVRIVSYYPPKSVYVAASTDAV